MLTHRESELGRAEAEKVLECGCLDALQDKVESQLSPRSSGCRLCRFFFRLVMELEGAIKKVDGILKEECRDLFLVAATCIFNHLLLCDPCFVFAGVMGSMLEESRGN
ncbi:hypothetical protein D1007_04604 [Hordeum vulgare]|nr:hypothetical protein D1007_04604 [Hordeum vulgare]